MLRFFQTLNNKVYGNPYANPFQLAETRMYLVDDIDDGLISLFPLEFISSNVHSSLSSDLTLPSPATIATIVIINITFSLKVNKLVIVHRNPDIVLTTPDIMDSCSIDDPSDWPVEELRKLDSDLRCTICSEYFDAPVLLSKCGHSFCSICVRRHFQIAEETKRKCPTCTAIVAGDVIPNRSMSFPCHVWLIVCRFRGNRADA